MYSTRTVVALALAILIVVPAIQASQANDGTALLRKVEDLGRVVADLQARVAALERAAGGGRAFPPPSGAVSPASRSREVWRTLRRGMSMEHVRRVLGEPGKVATDSLGQHWYYPDVRGGSVSFDSAGLLVGWSEP